MRTGKILGIVIGSMAAVLLLVLATVWLVVHPREYQSRIEAAVRESTGRPLLLQGDIHLSLFPWVALEFGPATLGNPPGFGAEPFLTLRHAAVRARLWPLLFGRLEMGGLDLDGLDVRLERDAQGRGNWEFPARAGAAPSAAPAGAPLQLERLGSVRIRDARLRFERYSVRKIELLTGPYGGNGVMPVSLTFEADRGVPAESLSFNAKVGVSSPGPDRYHFAAINLSGTVHRVPATRRIEWSFSAPAFDLDLGGGRIELPKFQAVFAAAQFEGALAATRRGEPWSLQGELTLAPLVLREFLPRFGVAPPATRDPHALAEVAGHVRYALEGDTWSMSPLELTLDDTHLSGSASLALRAAPVVRFALSADRIDLDRYRPPASAPEGAPAAAPAAKEAAAADESVRKIDLEGTLKVGAAQFAALDLNDLAATVTLREGVAHLYPLQAAFDGGRYAGDVTYDLRGTAPVLTMNEHLSNVDLARLPVLKGRRVRLTGRASMNLKASAHGEGAAALLRTLAGKADARVADGAVEGVDLAYELHRAQALLKRQAPPPAAGPKRTPFDTFKLSADIDNGVATTRDLAIAAQGLRVSGTGSANLATQALDLELSVDTPAVGALAALKVPLKVSGTMSDPTVRPDIEALAKGQLKDKLKDVLKDKLEGLFRKP